MLQFQIYEDVTAKGLSLIVIADWYNTDIMRQLRLLDHNTRSTWFPVTGGSNVPALNELLRSWKIALSTRVFEGVFDLGEPVAYSSGTSIAMFPKDGLVFSAVLSDLEQKMLYRNNLLESKPVLGFFQPSEWTSGRIAVYGDSGCFDDASMSPLCSFLIDGVMEFVLTGQIHPVLTTKMQLLTEHTTFDDVPVSPSNSTLYKYSNVIADAEGHRKALGYCSVRRSVQPQPAKKRSQSHTVAASRSGSRDRTSTYAHVIEDVHVPMPLLSSDLELIPSSFLAVVPLLLFVLIVVGLICMLTLWRHRRRASVPSRLQRA